MFPLKIFLGTSAPEFNLPDLAAKQHSLQSLRQNGLPVLLVFLHPSCPPCQALLPLLATWQRSLSAHLTIAVISSGSPRQNQPWQREVGLQTVLLQAEQEVAKAYLVYGTPSAVLITTEGKIGSPIAGGQEMIERLVAQAATPQSSPGIILPPGEMKATLTGNGECDCGKREIVDPNEYLDSAKKGRKDVKNGAKISCSMGTRRGRRIDSA